MDLFKIVGRIAIENAEANKALEETSDKAKKTANAVDDVGDSGEKNGGKFGNAMKKIGSGVAKAGKVIGTGLVAAGAAVGGLTIKAMNMGGELEQNMGGSEAVFKECAGRMQDTAKEAFGKMGLSTSDFLATANKMGALFQGAGFSIEESADLSADAMQRAADVASIMGIDTSAAMEAVAGAAKGNFTMMDNLGVAMNDTTLNAYAMEKGLNKTTQEMTNQEKIGLAMELFMEKTAYAAGNYAKENETLAGSLGTAKAALTNFLDGSGDVDQLVTAFTHAAEVIIGNLQEIAPRLISGLVDILNQLTTMLPGLIGDLLPVIISGAVSLVQGLVAAMPALLSTLINDVLPGLLSGVLQIFTAIIESLPQLIEMICSALPTLIPQLISGIISAVVILLSNFSSIIQPIIDYLPEIIVSIVDALLDNLPILIQGIITFVINLCRQLPQILMAIVKAVVGVITSIWSHIQEWFEAAGIGEWFRDLFGKAKEAVQNAWSSVTGFFRNIWNGIKNVFSSIGTWFRSKFNQAKTGVTNAWSSVTGFFSRIKNNIVNAFSNIKQKLSAPFEKARDAIKRIADKIKGFFKGTISMPKIKLPHFSLSPAGWKIGDLLKGSIPKLSIKWYAKAMDNPMLLTEPTIFGYNTKTGQALGGGEAGDEVVSGKDTLMEMIGQVVDSRTAAQNERLLDVLTDILDAIVGGNRDTLKALLAEKTFQVGEREFGRLVREYA